MAGSTSAIPASRRDRFLAQIPRTRQFSARRDRFVSEAEDELAERFNAPALSDRGLGKGTQSSLRAYRKEQAKSQFWQAVIWDWYLPWIWVLFWGSIATAVVLSSRPYPQFHLHWLLWIGFALLASFAALVLLAVFCLPIVLLSELILDYFSGKRALVGTLIVASVAASFTIVAMRRGWFATAVDWDYLFNISVVTMILLWILSLAG